ncbi:MAG TPA: PqqD family protein [Allosphingosinicella sp.]|jgi:hypothetical protein
MTGRVLRRDPDVVSAEVDGEPRLLHLRSWTYMAFDPIGERIWELLAEPRDEEGLVQALLAEFDGDEAQIRADVTAFLERLYLQGFLIKGGAF